jgi:hypothetical protein
MLQAEAHRVGVAREGRWRPKREREQFCLSVGGLLVFGLLPLLPLRRLLRLLRLLLRLRARVR